ncbi:MAG TPA: DUF3618 domain-containing protein [Candidatus Limnocylindria bacterium]|nr:DUF3618 domain-containing protein [Candidatus Limnocylindria bacterium]
MTLERDDKRLAQADATQADLETSSPAAADELDQMTDEEAAEAIEIRTEIEETRLEMGGTLSELGDRLEPGHLVNQAKENVREATIGRVEETAKGMSDMVMETIKRNPIPAAMAGAGLALLWTNRSSGNGHDRNAAARRYDAYYGTTSSYGQQQPYGQQGPGVGDRVGEAASKVGETVGQVGDNVTRTVGDVGENVGQGIGQMGGQLDRFMRASPLAVGAIALGAGALIGAVLPETQQEREMLSDAGRQIGNAVRDTVDQATARAEDAMDKAEEKVTSGASS